MQFDAVWYSFMAEVESALFSSRRASVTNLPAYLLSTHPRLISRTCPD